MIGVGAADAEAAEFAQRFALRRQPVEPWPRPVLHFALVESHSGIVANRVAVVNPRRNRGFTEETVNERGKMRWPRR
jgi:hypothetical protein